MHLRKKFGLCTPFDKMNIDQNIVHKTGVKDKKKMSPNTLFSKFGFYNYLQREYGNRPENLFTKIIDA